MEIIILISIAIIYLGIGAVLGSEYEIGMGNQKTMFGSSESSLIQRLAFMIIWAPFTVLAYILDTDK